MKNRYILLIALLQISAISYSVLFAYRIYSLTSNGHVEGKPYFTHFEYHAAAAFSNYGLFLYLIVLLWAVTAALLESGKFSFQPHTPSIAISGIALVFIFGIMGFLFSSFAWDHAPSM